MRLPHLSATAKAQLWGMVVGGTLAFYAVRKLDLSLGIFAIGWAASWVLGEMLFGARLIGHSDAKAIALGVMSGLAFPWVGFAAAWLLQLLRP